MPENVIPSADAQHLLQERRVSFQSLCHCAVRLPESFRGGCSFGAGSGPVSPAAMRTLDRHFLCTKAHGSTALYSICHRLFRRMWTSNHFRPLRGQKESSGTRTPHSNEREQNVTECDGKWLIIQRPLVSHHPSGRGGSQVQILPLRPNKNKDLADLKSPAATLPRQYRDRNEGAAGNAGQAVQKPARSASFRS